jgi:hypothetical protein
MTRAQIDAHLRVSGALEQSEIIGWFTMMLRAATSDGQRKRASGKKPLWKVDPAHEAALFSHLNKWKHGETVDADSGAHPLVHLAWRALAIAWQETYGAQPWRRKPRNKLKRSVPR